MNSADLLEIEDAAQAFGVSTDILRRRLDGGGLPEAVLQDGAWTVPAEALSSIAEREGWPLDLTTGAPEVAPVPEPLDRYINETMAAHAAVVLAKTQATAARAEARDLARRNRQLIDDLEAERAERERVTAQLSAAEKAQAILERDRAVAEARADELRRQVEQERVERSLLTSRIGILEADREEAITSMDWLSRRRYARRQGRSTGHPTPGWLRNLGANGFRAARSAERAVGADDETAGRGAPGGAGPEGRPDGSRGEREPLRSR